MNYELKPCPFCGGTDFTIETRGRSVAVICDFRQEGCGASGGYRDTEEEAVKTWKESSEIMREKVMENEKKIIDVCCGSKMFWFDKNNSATEFCDNRTMPKTEYYPNRYIEISPDTVCDFTNLPFPDNTFYLAVFDPPHLEHVGENSIMFMKYGKLKGDWRTMLSVGFDECMRVLKPNGVLIFKWSEVQIPLSEILPLFNQDPLFGNRHISRSNKTHWLCFMKVE